MTWLSTNFHTSEFACKCGCGFGTGPSEVSARLIVLLEAIRADIGRSVFLESGCRCPSHNENEGGVENSAHTLGEAADIRATGGTAKHEIQKAAYRHGAMGVGVGKNFVHVDVHNGEIKHRPSSWGY
jgi:uncharacterized protein YcbK (DUF882 family)